MRAASPLPYRLSTMQTYRAVVPAPFRRASASPFYGPPADSSGPYRSGAWQLDRAFQPGMIVFELELAAVEPRDRGRQAQAEAGARLGAALLQAHEALDHPATIGFRNPRPAILDAERNALAFILGLDDDLRGAAVELARRRIFDGVVDQIGQRLADQLAIAAHRCRPRGIDFEHQALLFGQRFVQFADVVRDLGGIEFIHVVAGMAGFGARDHQ